MPRKRKPGRREPNGKPSRKIADKKAAWDMEQRDNLSVGFEARQRLFGFSEKQARSQDAGSFIGRLCIGGELSREQYYALLAYGEEERAVSLTTVGPKGDGAFDPNRVAGRGGPSDENSERRIIERWRETTKFIDRLEQQLRSVVSLHWVLYQCVVMDREYLRYVGDLRLAANALIGRYRLMEKAA